MTPHTPEMIKNKINQTVSNRHKPDNAGSNQGAHFPANLLAPISVNFFVNSKIIK